MLTLPSLDVWLWESYLMTGEGGGDFYIFLMKRIINYNPSLRNTWTIMCTIPSIVVGI